MQLLSPVLERGAEVRLYTQPNDELLGPDAQAIVMFVQVITAESVLLSRKPDGRGFRRWVAKHQLETPKPPHICSDVCLGGCVA